MTDELYEPRVVAILKAARVLGDFQAGMLALANDAAVAGLGPFEVAKRLDMLVGDMGEAIGAAAARVEEQLVNQLVKDRYGVDEGDEGQLAMARVALHRGAWSDPVRDAIIAGDSISMSLQLLSRRLDAFDAILKTIDGGERFNLSIERVSGDVWVVADGERVADLVAAYAPGADGKPSGFLGLVMRAPGTSGRTDARIVVLGSDEMTRKGIDLFTMDEAGANLLLERFPATGPAPR